MRGLWGGDTVGPRRSRDCISWIGVDEKGAGEDEVTLEYIRSGGQTGVDQTGLFVAREHGIKTGGWAPKGWRTEAGPAPWLEDFGLVEHVSPSFKPRTHANVRDADLTVWFGKRSPGFFCTLNGAELHQKQMLVNPTVVQLVKTIQKLKVKELNVAGNRLENHPEASDLARAILTSAILQLQTLDNPIKTL